MSEEIPGEDSGKYWGQWCTQEHRHHWEAFRGKHFTATSGPNKTLVQSTTHGSPPLYPFDRLVFSTLRNEWFHYFSFCFSSEILEQCFSGWLKQVVTTIPGNNQRPNECDSSFHGNLWPQLWPSLGVLIWASWAGALKLLDTKVPTCTSHLGLEEHEALACHKDRMAGPLLGLSGLLRKGQRERISGRAAQLLSGGEFRMLMCLPPF